MIEKTAGLVLHSLKYGESSVIVKIYTRKLGMQSYLVPGVRKRNARIRQNLFQPLSILDLVVYHKEQGNLQRIKEIGCPEPYRHIPFDIARTSIALFLAEVVLKSVREQEANEGLYDFLAESFRFLDATEGSVSNFHLLFLLRFSRFLGFAPRDNRADSCGFFNMQEGVYEQAMGDEKHFMDKALSSKLHLLQSSSFEGLQHLGISASVRRALLHKLIDYYRLHTDGMQQLKSLAVLESVLE